MKLLVAFSGKAGCGKSTIASALVEDFGFVKVSIADELKRIVQKLYPEKVKGVDKNVYRWVYQQFGDDTRRIDKDVWLRQRRRFGGDGIDLFLRLALQKVTQERTVIDDLRFKNEFFGLRRAGFILIRVERDPRLLTAAGYDPYDSHPSECDLDDLAEAGAFDLRVQNDGEYPFQKTLDYVVKFLGL